MRKKILFLSDDFRMTSGVARMSREIIEKTIHKYDWVQIAGAIEHPDNGKRIQIQSDDKFQLPEGSSITLYPTSGYGNPDMLRQVMEIEKPDAILHFTDPRFWIWLYQMEHEIRTKIPIMYYNIWDDLPDPLYNTNYYRSCDLLLAISKQTYGINKRTLSPHGYEDWQIRYIPHGIDNKKYFKIKANNKHLIQSFEEKLGVQNYTFKILYCNRNIRRKNPGDVVLAYKDFMDSLNEKQRKECCLIFHTAVRDDNGTDLAAVVSALCPNYNVIFTNARYSDEEMNLLYNSSDVYVNIASNEGFGLGSAEAHMTGTPSVLNVTGGLQDQCGFKKEDGTYLTADDYSGKWGSNHNGKYREHGEWVKPVFPATISLQGSPLTPYIFDDRVRWDDTGEAISYWYHVGPKVREKCGEKAIEFVKSKDVGQDADVMGKKFIEAFDVLFTNWKPKRRYIMEEV